MPRCGWLPAGLCCLLASAASGGTELKADDGIGERVHDDLTFLSSLGSRVVGYPGHVAAADFIEQRFGDLGLSDVRRDTFEIAVPIDRGGQLRIIESDTRIPLLSLWPNLVRTATLPPEGLAGSMFYAGHGSYEELTGHILEGRVALMEFNSQLRWLNLAALGVRAIIFIEPEETTTYEAHRKFSYIPVDIPRFWIDRDAGTALRRRLHGGGQIPVELSGRMDWESRPTWNISATVPGTAASTTASSVFLHAYYDGSSVVPALDPGAETASGIACLLETARHLARRPGPRETRIVALSAHFQANQGMARLLDRRQRQRLDGDPPDLFIGLELSAGADEVGYWNNTDEFALKRLFLPYSRVLSRHGADVAIEQGRDPGRAFVNGITPLRGRDWLTYVPQKLVTDGEVALESGVPSLTLATVNDLRQKPFTPLDRPQIAGFTNVAGQAGLVREVLRRALADSSFYSGTQPLARAITDQLTEVRVRARTFPRRSQIPDGAVPGAVVMLSGFDKQVSGVMGQRYAIADEHGNVTFRGVNRDFWYGAAYSLEPVSGRVAMAPDLSKRSEPHHGKADRDGQLPMRVEFSSQERTLVMFRTVPRPLYSLISPRGLRSLASLRLFDAGGAPPREHGRALSFYEEEPVGLVFGGRGAEWRDRVRLVLGESEPILLLNADGHESEAEARGRGFLLRDDDIGETTLAAAKDMWQLDEYRLNRLSAHGIRSPWLERLHAATAQLTEDAGQARKDLRWDRYIALSRKALGLESRVYPELLASLNDIISGMVFVLSLLIPAVFFAERLLIAAVDIRRQLTGIAAIMLALWLVLSQIHPAFQLAQPVVIFLGFAIMAIALFVLVMIGSRFSRVTRDIGARIGAVHQADISRFGAAYSAFMLGISNMRRRPLRSALTLTTLTLLTFSVMSFTSFPRQTRFVTLAVDADATRSGALARSHNWESLDITEFESLQTHFEPVATLAARSWSVQDHEGARSLEVRHADSVAEVLGIIGMMPTEAAISGIDSTILAGSFFESNAERSCLLPGTVARDLGLEFADVGRVSVRVWGVDMQLRGIFDEALLDSLLDIDGGSLTPIDRRLSTLPPGAEMMDELELMEMDVGRNFVHLPADRVVILPFGTHVSTYGSLRSVAIDFDTGIDETLHIEDYLERISTTLFASVLDGSGGRHVVRYSSVGLTSVEGLPRLVVPALIAALIVLNAMLGAVYERWREIGIYSSVGLSPLHIAVLFFAEACVFAILGVTLGYLAGQGLGRLLQALGLMAGISLNYSSVAAMVSSSGVIAVVLVSTIYPARLAAAMATPEASPRWRPPPPEGDHWYLPFPFNVSEADVVGMGGFLYSYFESHAGAISGNTYTEDLSLRRDIDTDGARYHLTFRLWLSPYDLGVSEAVRIELRPAEGARGMYAVFIDIRRHSGERFHWQRLNRPFFQRLRKQLLIWNALPAGERARHRIEGARQLESETVPETPVTDVASIPTDATESQPTGSPFSVKGLAVGAAMCLAVGVGATYGEFFLKGSRMTLNSTAPMAIFYFFVIVAVANLGVFLARRRLRLPVPDLILIYIMMTLAATVPNQSFVGYLIPVLAGYLYYATSANHWVELYGEHLPAWSLPDAEAAIVLHEGLAPGQSIPWVSWLAPLGSWYLFFMALTLMMICLNVILHRQWSIHERLEYPMVQLPLAIVGRDEGSRSGMPTLLHRPLMWVGFGVPFVLLGLKGLHHYIPAVPVLFTPSFGSLEILEGLSLSLFTNYAWVGISYLVSLDISLSIWVFFVLGRLQDTLFTKFGVAPTEQLSFYSLGSTADLAHQATGACFVFVLVGLWMARRHLRDVWNNTVHGDAVDDAEELMPYRLAVIGLAVSFAVVSIWLWASGIPLIVLPAFLLSCIVFYILVTRVIATAGVATARAPMISAFVVISGVGSTLIGAKGLAALALTYVWQGEMRLFPMIMTANGLKLAEAVRGPKGRLFWGMLIAVTVSLAGATWMTLDLAHTHGGVNLDKFLMNDQANRLFNDMARHVRQPVGPDWRGWGFTGLGAAIEAMLIGAQYRFAWWPLHPIGFIISNGWLTGQIWFAVFIGWGAKSQIMKYGGTRTYLRLKPLFLGLILGEAVSAGTWLVLDYLLGGTGNRITMM